MPKQAQLEDGTVLEFPDDTPDDVIDRAVRSHLGVESPKAWEPKKRSVADLQAAAAQYQAAHPVTDDMSFAQQVGAGYGKSYMDTWRGAKQLVGQEDVAGIEDSRAMDAALDDSPGGRTGKIAGQTVQIATPIPGSAAVKATAWAGRAAPYVGAAARAGAFGALQPTGLGESRAANAAESAAWGAAGQGVASGLGYLAKGAKNALAEPVRRSIDAAKRAGIPLHVSQVTNSPFLKTLSSTINSVLPFTGAQKAGQRQQEAFMRAISRTFGMDAPALTDDVMKAAKGRIGQAYDAIFSRNKVDLRNQDIQKLVQIERAARLHEPGVLSRFEVRGALFREAIQEGLEVFFRNHVVPASKGLCSVRPTSPIGFCRAPHRGTGGRSADSRKIQAVRKLGYQRHP